MVRYQLNKPYKPHHSFVYALYMCVYIEVVALPYVAREMRLDLKDRAELIPSLILPYKETYSFLGTLCYIVNFTQHQTVNRVQKPWESCVEVVNYMKKTEYGGGDFMQIFPCRVQRGLLWTQ
jgi:hypothetical protein